MNNFKIKKLPILIIDGDETDISSAKVEDVTLYKVEEVESYYS